MLPLFLPGESAGRTERLTTGRGAGMIFPVVPMVP